MTLTPAALLVPAIMALSLIGGWANRSIFNDIIVVLIFGGFGYLAHKNRYPIACLILGLVLGPLVEENFYRGLQIGKGSLKYFISTPISICIWILIAVVLIWGLLPIREGFQRLRARCE